MKNFPRASIAVPLYNSDRYIRECLDSLLAQECTFPFEIIVSDDGSTDGSRDILREYAGRYPGVIVPVYNEKNLGVIGNFCSGIQHARGQYLAFCDNDDFWNDPKKLQKQVDLLEKNPLAVLVYADNRILHEMTGKITESIRREKELTTKTGRVFEDLMNDLSIGPVTVCARTAAVKDAVHEIKLADRQEWKTPDYPLWLALALKGDFLYIDEPLATYRNRGESVSVSSDKAKRAAFKYGTWKIREYFLSKGEVSPEVREKVLEIGGDRTVLHFFYSRDYDELRRFVKNKEELKIRSRRAKMIKKCAFSDFLLDFFMLVF